MTLSNPNWPRMKWPYSVRVPVFVALLMVAISIAVSYRALSRLEETQQRSLQQLSSAYLDGLSASLVPSVVREDVWEVFDTLDRSRERYQGLGVRWATVTNAAGRVIASSLPEQFPPLEPMPEGVKSEFDDTSEIVSSEERAEARLQRTLRYQEQEIGHIYAVADISALLQERTDILRELVITNVLLTVLLVAFGIYVMRRMARPIGILSEYLARSRAGAMTAIPADVVSQQSREFRDIFESYNGMTQAVSERELLAAELAREEKLASVGRLASGMAHEINNPLGGMFNAIDSLKRYGAREEVRNTSIRLLEQGLSGIRDLVRSTLTTYRLEQRPRDLTAMDLDDLRLLVKPEARHRKLSLKWDISLEGPVPVPAVPVRDAVLNLLINACHSCADGGRVGLSCRIAERQFIAEISDSGTGLPSHIREYVERKGAGAAPLDRASGLGLWIVKRHCDEMGASIVILNSTADGTTLRLTIPLQSEVERAA